MAPSKDLTSVVFNFTTGPVQKLVRGNSARIAKKIEHIFKVEITKNKNAEDKVISKSWNITGQEEDAKAARYLLIELQDFAHDILPEDITIKGINRKLFREMNNYFDKRLDELRNPNNNTEERNTAPAVVTEKKTSSLTSNFNHSNEDQNLAHSIILTPGVSVTSLIGGPGSGKSYVAISAAFNLVKQNHADKVVIVRPQFNNVNKLGAVPGSMEKKMSAHTQALANNIFNITGKSIQRLTEERTLDIFCYNDGEQGNTHHNVVMIIDDCQSIPATDIRTMMTRIGGNAGKIVLTGDISGGQDTIRQVSNLSQVICGFGKSLENNPDLIDKFAFVSFAPSSMNTRHPDMQDIVNALDSEEIINAPAFRQSEEDKKRLNEQRANAQKSLKKLDQMTRVKYTLVA